MSDWTAFEVFWIGTPVVIAVLGYLAVRVF